MASIDNVQDISPRVQYTAIAAQTIFTYPFPIFLDADIVVDVDGVLKVLTTDYTVSGAGNETGGNVTFVVAMAGNEVVTIYRDIAVARATDFQQNGPWSSKTFNDELDKIILILQELENKIGRSIRFPITAASTNAQAEMAPVSNFFGKFLRVTSGGILEAAEALTNTVALTAELIGGLLYPQTAAELAAGATPINFRFVESHFSRYGNNTTPGTTDMLVAVQAACDTSANGGSDAFIPSEIFAVSNFVTVASNTTLRGEGKSSAIKGLFAAPLNRIITSSVSVQQTNIILKDFCVDRTHANSQHGVLLGGIKNLLIDNLYILGQGSPTVTSGALGVSAFDSFADIQSENVRVENLVIEKSNNFGIAFGYVKNGIIDKINLIDCFREGIGIEGFDALPSDGTPKGNEGITVSNITMIVTEDSNHFGGSNGPAVVIGGSNSKGYTRDVTCSNITIIGTETVASQGYIGVLVDGGAVLATEDISISGVTVKNMNGPGVQVGAAGHITRDVTLSDIKVIDCNQGVNSSPSGAAVELRNATDCLVYGITAKGSNHTHIVEETSGSDNNVIYGLKGDPGTVADYAIIGASSVLSEPINRQSEIVTATNVITAAENGKTFYLNAAGGFTSTLPAPAANLKFKFIVKTAPTTAYIITTNAGADILQGTFLDIVGELVAISAQDTLNFVANVSLVGDSLEVESDGISWFCTAFSKADGGITVAVT